MSNLVAPDREVRCRRAEHDAAITELPGREAQLGEGLVIRRLLPQKRLRLVGPWCFFDHFGPLEMAPGDAGMRVGPHPHIGLQTVTWLFEGEILHRDSLGYRQLIRPGQLNLMTAGHGITHSEETPETHGPRLHGVQLWVALPRDHAETHAMFEHYGELPVIERDGMRCTLFAGHGMGAESPATSFSPLVGSEIELLEAGERALPLDPAFEHAVVPIEGSAVIGSEISLRPGCIYDLGQGRASLPIKSGGHARMILIGGAPFGEELILWWNFVGRSHREIADARAGWEAGRRFGKVRDYDGAPMEAPPLASRLRAR